MWTLLQGLVSQVLKVLADPRSATGPISAPPEPNPRCKPSPMADPRQLRNAAADLVSVLLLESVLATCVELVPTQREARWRIACPVLLVTPVHQARQAGRGAFRQLRSALLANWHLWALCQRRSVDVCLGTEVGFRFQACYSSTNKLNKREVSSLPCSSCSTLLYTALQGFAARCDLASTWDVLAGLTAR
jgi:hypothetical protein